MFSSDDNVVSERVVAKITVIVDVALCKLVAKRHEGKEGLEYARGSETNNNEE